MNKLEKILQIPKKIIKYELEIIPLTFYVMKEGFGDLMQDAERKTNALCDKLNPIAEKVLPLYKPIFGGLPNSMFDSRQS